MSKRSSVLLLIILLTGCASTPLPPVKVEPPYLMHLPGIGGERGPDRRMIMGLRDGGYTGEIETYDWTEDAPGLPALVNYERNHRESVLIARKLTVIRRASPRREIIITAHSGGTGLAVWALEKLPADVQIDRVVFLSSALSPGYDLSPALRHVSGRMYNFWSRQDVAILNAGTTIFGTIDGVKSPAAGFEGFVASDKLDAVQYQKLEQIPYDATWLHWGNNGGHIGPMSGAFASHVIAPLIDDPLSAIPVSHRGAIHVPPPATNPAVR